MNEPPLLAWRLDQAHVAVSIDLRLYSIDAAMRAAYKFTDRCFVLLQNNQERSDELIAFLIGRSSSADLSSIVLELQNELLDQQIRCRLEDQFSAVRTLIVAQAFSEGNLIDPTADGGDYRDDPLGAGKHR